MSTIGNRIRDLRLKRGLTQDQIAEQLNMNRANFSHYERDNAIPPGETLGKIADILNTTTDYLLGRTNNISCIPVSDPNSIDDEPEIRAIQRAAKNMTKEDRVKMLKMLEIAFEEAFDEEP